MNFSEKNLIDALIDLKENHNVLGIKAEFEDEGASVQEIYHLQELAIRTGLDLTIKIGGCGALNDINQAKKLGANSIVAPMIESSYAVKKFIQSIEMVYLESGKPNLFINIETITGYKNFKEILSTEESKDITGIVVGRFDMAKSIGLGCKETNEHEIFQLVNALAIKTKPTNKIFTVGGGVSEKSLEFFNNLSYLNRFETRKIIFDAQSILKRQDKEGILKAIYFEIMWLNAKQNTYGIFQNKDEKRLKTLQERYKKLVEYNYCP